MAGVLFVYEGVVARRCHRHRTRPCVFVCCAFYCCCCCCCCCAGVYCVASVDVQSLVQFLSRFRIVTASFTAVGIPRWPEPKSPSSHFPPAPTSSGRGIFVVVLRQAGQIDWTDEEQQNARKCGQKRVGADQSSENREVPVVVRPNTGGRWCWSIT